MILQGATIGDQSVCISKWGSYGDNSYPWDSSTWKIEEDTSSSVCISFFNKKSKLIAWFTDQILGKRFEYVCDFKPLIISPQITHMHPFVSSPGEAVTVVKTMLAKGYVLGKDALIKAKDLDESYRVSATAAAKVAELSNRIGLTDKINTSMETVKSVDEKYHVSDITKSVASVTGTAVVTAASFTGRTAVAATNAVVNSSYFAKGALWVSGMLNRAAQAAADLGKHGNKQTNT